MWVDEFHCHLRIWGESKYFRKFHFSFISECDFSKVVIYLYSLIWARLVLLALHYSQVFWNLRRKAVLADLRVLLLAGTSQCFDSWTSWQNKLDRPPGKDRSSHLWVEFQSNTGTGAQVKCSCHPWRFSGLDCKKAPSHLIQLWC